MKRDLELTHERLTAYSRSGNFHSDPDAAAKLGYEGMVAQGMQVAGPAYGLALDAWGEAFLAHGTFEAKFVGMVFEGTTVTAAITSGPPSDDLVDALADADSTVFEVTIPGPDGPRTVVVGRASRS